MVYTAGNMKKLRTERGFTQVELANKCGVSRETICKFENMQVGISQVSAHKIANVLNVPYEVLISHEDDPKPVSPRVVNTEEREKRTANPVAAFCAGIVIGWLIAYTILDLLTLI